MRKCLSQYDVIFWDFDGTIKDSTKVKSDAFVELFALYGSGIEGKIRKHHEENSGVSRYDKIPLYLKWSKQYFSDEIIEDYCSRFSRTVINNVISSPWIEGVREFILDGYKKQIFILVTATPVDEMNLILERLGILNCFQMVYGYPTEKQQAIDFYLNTCSLEESKRFIMIGDSLVDYLAAINSNIDFLLRKADYNSYMIQSYECNYFTGL